MGYRFLAFMHFLLKFGVPEPPMHGPQECSAGVFELGFPYSLPSLSYSGEMTF